ncbi:LysR family transcriptional regulator [Nocardia sp. NPDC057663]|uniref:LysR family transcriptional regulator n=1 Tax=Nocardia sp. NPDC057663 TaxID=3346201 RepID=UPI00366E3959
MPARFTLTQLEYFLEVADGGSISAAAASTHTSPGAISMALKELEQRLDVQLFVRRPSKAATLTAAGQRILADARRILADADELHNKAASDQHDITGHLAVGCYSTLAPFLIPPVLDDFAREHPALTVQILEGSGDTVLDAITEGRCELGFLYKQDLPGGIESAVVRTSKPHVILANDHPLAAHRTIRLADLVDEPLIMFDGPSARNAAALLESVGLQAHIRHFSSNIEVVRSLVARGIGYSILVQQWPIEMSYEGRPLAARPIQDSIPERETVLAWSSGTKLTSRAVALIDFCIATFRDDSRDYVF